jgi:hypothetical protein
MSWNNIAPCMDGMKRELGCHSDCNSYKVWNASNKSMEHKKG